MKRLQTLLIAAVVASAVMAGGQEPGTSGVPAQAKPTIRIRSNDLLRRGSTNTVVVAGAPVDSKSAQGVNGVNVAQTSPTSPAPAYTPRAVPTPPAGAPPAAAPQTNAPPAAAGGQATLARGAADEGPIEFDWMNADLLQVLAKYSELTHRSPIMQQNIQGMITFRSAGPLTLEEAIGALESVLLVNGFAIVPMGDKFFKVVPSTVGAQEGVPISKEDAVVKPYDRIIAQIVRVKYLDAADVQRALTSGSTMPGVPGQPGAPGGGGGRVFMHPYGQIVAMPRSNALLIIDTALNVSRLKEIIEYMDTTSESKMETRVYVLENASAANVANILQQLISADQGTGTMGMTGRAGVPGMPAAMPFQGNRAGQQSVATDENVILGKVLASYDERTNAIILITQEVNFSFFEKIIKALDVKTNQDFKTKVFFLNYSDAGDMTDMLNQLIQGGSVSPTTTRRQGTQGGSGGSSRTNPFGSTSSGRGGSTSSRTGTSASRNTSAQSSLANRSTFGSGSRTTGSTPYGGAATPGAPGATPSVSPSGAAAAQIQLQIKIIPDYRNNAIIISAAQADLDAFADVIKQLDVFPPQVAIDVVVAEVSLNDQTTFGVDLFQKSLGNNPAGAGISSPGGDSLKGTTRINQGSSTNSASGTISKLIDPKSLTGPSALPAGLTGGLTYFASFFGGDLNAYIQALQGDSRVKILQTPHIYTSNNQAARIFVGQSRPFVTSVQTTLASDQSRSTYENVDIGVGLQVTPLINPDGVVTLNVYQTVDDVAGTQIIDGNEIPILSRREAEAVAVTVKDGQIIILGGLTANKREKDESKVPVLGDVPLLGYLFKRTTWIDTKTELVFFLRPKVIRTIEEAQRYTWGRIEKSKDLRKMPISDTEGNSPLQDKRYGDKLKALDKFDKSDKF